MKKEYNLSYEEIYYSSTEKSAISGRAGFGIRSYTEGMQVNEVEEIIRQCQPGYQLPTSKMVSRVQLDSNPDIVYDYPITYDFRQIKLSDGTLRYLMERTVYVGIDYGFFNGGTALRTGSNFFSHLLVFKQKPSPELLGAMVSGNLCVPQNRSCRPDNAEWNALLTGEMALLPRKESVEIEVSDDTSVIADPRFMMLVKAMLQAHINKTLGQDSMMQQVLIKTTVKESDELVRMLSLFPKELLSEFPFTSNSMQGGAMPGGCRMAMVNDWNTSQLYLDNYISIDFTTSHMAHVDNNYFFDKMSYLANAKEYDELYDLIVYFMGMDYSQVAEYPFFYDLFVILQTPDELPLEKIDKIFVDKIQSLSLSEENAGKIWGKINASIKKSIFQNNSKSITDALVMVEYMREKKYNMLRIDSETISYFTKLLISGNDNLKIFSSKCTNNQLLPLVDMKLISAETLFKSLHSCDKSDTWYEFLKQFYGDRLVDNMPLVVNNVAASQLRDKDNLISRFYPIASNGQALLKLIHDNPSLALSLKGTTSSLCSAASEEVFSYLINASDQYKSSIANILSRSALDYYGAKMKKKHNTTANELVALCGKLSPKIFVYMGLDSLFEEYANFLYSKPTKAVMATIKSVLDLGIADNKNGMTSLRHIYAMQNQKTFDDVTYEDLLFDAGQSERDSSYTLKLFAAWLEAKRRDINSVIAYIDKLEWTNYDKKTQRDFIRTVWKSKNQGQERIAVIMHIIDLSKWNKDELTEFINKCHNSETYNSLGEAIEAENTFFKKVGRFFKKIFKKDNK